MATKRKRGNTWEYVVRRKSLLPKPLYLTYDDEAAGDAFVAHLEGLLDAGIVPSEFSQKPVEIKTVAELVRRYLLEAVQGASDVPLLNRIYERWGTTELATATTFAWVESWVALMKREARLSPETIKKYVGALARCFDWALNKNLLAINPCRMLPKRYAAYSAADEVAAGVVRVNVERDRRLEEGEEKRILDILDGAKPEGKQRPLTMNEADALQCLFGLALETGMRMREMYTLSGDQVDLKKRTIFLDKTKNGDKRQVPLSGPALDLLRGFKVPKGKALLFPWWDGDLGTLKKVTSKLSKQFGRVFEAAKCDDLRFHDLRHEFTCRLFERTQLSDLQIAKITGHKDLRMLKRYANLRASDLAGQLW